MLICKYYLTKKLVKSPMKIQKASEDYLESMLMMKEMHGYVPVSYTHLTLPTICSV